MCVCVDVCVCSWLRVSVRVLLCSRVRWCVCLRVCMVAWLVDCGVECMFFYVYVCLRAYVCVYVFGDEFTRSVVCLIWYACVYWCVGVCVRVCA